MKINPVSNQSLLQTYRAGKATAPEASRKKSQLDEISISDEALSFSKTLADIRDKMETRSSSELEHINEIKNKVRQGSYHVDSGLVAGKILQSIISE